jgi:hypothetical protein
MASNGSCFMVTWTTFRNHLLEVKPNTKPRDHGTIECSHPLIYSILSCVRDRLEYKIHSNSSWLRAQSHITSHYTRGSVTAIHDFGDVFGQPLTLSFGRSQSRGTALGSCVK